MLFTKPQYATLARAIFDPRYQSVTKACQSSFCTQSYHAMLDVFPYFPKTKDWGSLSYLGEKKVIRPYHYLGEG